MTRRPRRRPRRSRTSPSTSAALLAGPLLGMGVLHGAVPAPFDALVPRWLPGTARFWTYASGVAELAVGAAVAVPTTRRLGALAAAGLFVGVFPANLQMAWDWRTKPWPYRTVALGRLPLQYPMIAHALRVRREAVHRQRGVGLPRGRMVAFGSGGAGSRPVPPSRPT